MKNVSVGLEGHLSYELTTLAYMVKITCASGDVIGLTSHDRDLLLDGVVYKADGALSSVGIVSSASDTSDQQIEVSGVLDSDLLSEDDIVVGRFDNARIDMFMCNWDDLEQGVLHLRRGWLGDIVMHDGAYRASFLPFDELLNKTVGETYTPECRFDLGDERCGVDCELYKVTGSVTSVVDRRRFVDTECGEASDYYTDAKLTWVSGGNVGVSAEVSHWDDVAQEFTFWLALPHEIKIGDAYEIVAGCDKRFATCKARFGNGGSFGGFPHLPGIGKILQYPG